MVIATAQYNGSPPLARRRPQTMLPNPVLDRPSGYTTPKPPCARMAVRTTDENPLSVGQVARRLAAADSPGYRCRAPQARTPETPKAAWVSPGGLRKRHEMTSAYAALGLI